MKIVMRVGICTIELHIPDANSLKAKRQVLKSLKDKIRAKFNVSIAEVDENELWQKAILGVSSIGNGTGHINAMLDKVIDFIEGIPVVEIVDYKIEII